MTSVKLSIRGAEEQLERGPHRLTVLALPRNAGGCQGITLIVAEQAGTHRQASTA